MKILIFYLNFFCMSKFNFFFMQLSERFYFYMDKLVSYFYCELYCNCNKMIGDFFLCIMYRCWSLIKRYLIICLIQFKFLRKKKVMLMMLIKKKSYLIMYIWKIFIYQLVILFFYYFYNNCQFMLFFDVLLYYFKLNVFNVICYIYVNFLIVWKWKFIKLFKNKVFE